MEKDEYSLIIDKLFDDIKEEKVEEKAEVTEDLWLMKICEDNMNHFFYNMAGIRLSFSNKDSSLYFLS